MYVTYFLAWDHLRYEMDADTHIGLPLFAYDALSDSECVWMVPGTVDPNEDDPNLPLHEMEPEIQ